MWLDFSKSTAGHPISDANILRNSKISHINRDNIFIDKKVVEFFQKKKRENEAGQTDVLAIKSRDNKEHFTKNQDIFVIERRRMVPRKSG